MAGRAGVVASAVAKTTTGIMDLLHRPRTERRMTLVVVSHEHHLVARHTDAVHVLGSGHLTHSGPTRDFLPEQAASGSRWSSGPRATHTSSAAPLT